MSTSIGSNRQLSALLHKQAREQPRPLGHGETEGVEKYDGFFRAMADLWSLAAKHNLTDQIEFTNFIIFGPQSAGKTTLTERILGFPVAVVKRDVGTTRPVVLMTRRDDKEGVRVKGAGKNESFVDIDRERVMIWATNEMKGTGIIESTGVPRISKDRIHIEVSGPNLMDRRFVDLPGYQMNDEGTRSAILELLREEASRPNTVVVCIDDADLDYAISPLIKAIDENRIFGTKFSERKDKSSHFLLALNKSDKWLGTDITEDLFTAKLRSYLNSFGILPIVVGGSVAQPSASREDFRAIVDQYSTADAREAEIYSSFFRRVSFGEETRSLLEKRFMGFNTFLGTVDAMVVSRDIRNFGRISQQLSNICDHYSQQIKELKRKVNFLKGGKDSFHDVKFRTNLFLGVLLTKLSEIATADSGRGGSQAGSSKADIRKYGNNSFQEEMEFVLGRRSDSNPPAAAQFGGGYYSPDRHYEMQSGDIMKDAEAEAMWTEQIFKTLQDLQETVHGSNPNLDKIHGKNADRSEVISYIGKPLIVGSVYERALSVWSGSVYKLLIPSEEDLDRLANVVGLNFELKSPNEIDFKKPKRLAEIYIERLAPAVHFLCQKIEFLLLKMFDTAWRVVVKIDQNSAFVEAVGGAAFRREVRHQFESCVRDNAEIAYNKSFSDLRNEILKLLPYGSDQASVSGMMYAFPGVAGDIRDSKEAYSSDIAQVIKDKCAGYLNTLLASEAPKKLVEGMIFGIGVIADAGSIDPLILAGVQLVKHLALTTTDLTKVKKNRQKRDSRKEEEQTEEGKDEWLLGVACSFYAHFLPRFISTIDGRMRGDLWACVKDPQCAEKIKSQVIQSKVMAKVEDRVGKYQRDIKNLDSKKDELVAAREVLEAICMQFPESESVMPNAPIFQAHDYDDEDEEEAAEGENKLDHKGAMTSSKPPLGQTNKSLPMAVEVSGAGRSVDGIYSIQGGNKYVMNKMYQIYLEESNDGEAEWFIGRVDGQWIYRHWSKGKGTCVPFDGWRNRKDQDVPHLRVFDAFLDDHFFDP